MPCTPLNLVAAIAWLEGQAVEELHDAGHGFAAAEVGDIDPFDRPRRFGQLEHLFQAGEPLFRVDVKDFGLGVGIEVAAAVERFEQLDFVAQAGGLLELQLLGGVLHFALHFGQQARPCPLPESGSGGRCRVRYSSLLIRRLQGAVHCLMLASRHGRNQRQRSSPSSMSRLQVRNLKIRCRTCTAPRSAPALAKGPNSRTPWSARRAGDFDAGEILARRDHQVGKRLVVLQLLVVVRLDVLDQPRFHQQGIDFAFALDEIDVGDFVHPDRPCGVRPGPPFRK